MTVEGRRRAWITTISLAALGAFVLLVNGAARARFHRLETDLYDVSGRPRWDAAFLLAESGEAGLQVLLAAVTDDDVNVRAAAAFGLADLGPAAAPATHDLVRIATQETPLGRMDALRALERIGPAATEVVPFVAELLGDDGTLVRTSAGRCLAGLGDAGIEALIASLDDPSADVRRAALQGICTLHEEGRPLATQVATCLDDPTPAVRAVAATILVQLGEFYEPAFEVLMECLNGPCPVARSTAGWVMPIDG